MLSVFNIKQVPDVFPFSQHCKTVPVAPHHGQSLMLLILYFFILVKNNYTSLDVMMLAHDLAHRMMSQK